MARVPQLINGTPIPFSATDIIDFVERREKLRMG